ncbi:MAG: type I-C CRISPR-associated protein Cas7/Csd2 [Anaerolineae bacterium]|nr:type I-C CRISPR-associated protein Cas7/Csd2 [Anaerolineae bacterium]
MSTVLRNRYEFVMLYDVENGNPNGDPDAGNMPRIDPETGYGIVTDVCLKRKIRNYVELVKGDAPGFKIYVKENTPLNAQHRTAYIEKGWDPNKVERKETEKIYELSQVMCRNFYDVRTFGAVMSTKVNCGQVRGPVQINFSRSIDPIVQQEVTITRMTVTGEEEDKITEMGRKHIVPYGLYRAEGYISARLANDANKGTGFSEEDLDLLWDALMNLFEHDHSASRGKMATRKLIVFKHDSDLGNAPSHQLFDLVKVARLPGVIVPRAFSDYSVKIEHDQVPAGVALIEKI